MLSEGFLRVLTYREEQRFAPKTKVREEKHVDMVCSGLDTAAVTEGHAALVEIENDKNPVPNRDTSGLLIPGRPVNLTPDPFLADCLENCSLLHDYPDLQVADSGPLPHTKATATPQPLISPVINVPIQVEPVPDQGYLVMGGSVNVSVDVQGLEPMSNSVLNGMLEKKLEEVYLQHLTENLARCHSNLGNSLLHGLVPPLQPNSKGLDSLEVSVEEAPTSSEKTISYLNTAPSTSNFSSPVLRISEHHQDFK